jgi:ribosomal protein L34E
MEYCLPPACRSDIKAPVWRSRGWNCKLIKRKSGELRSDKVRRIPYVSETIRCGYRKLRGVVQSRIEESPTTVHFQVSHKRIQWVTEPQPVHVCRFIPANPKAGGINVAAETFVPVTTPFEICCGLNALPSSINSASNFPGPQLLSTVRTVS